MNNSIFKFIALPVVLLSTILTGCNNSTPVQSDEITYRDVIIEDYSKQEKYGFANMYSDIKDIEISRSYIFVNDSITFLIQPTIVLDDSFEATYFDDIKITFNHGNYPMVWKDHQIYMLSEGYIKGFYTRDDMLQIKYMFENDINDFSILDQPYIEKEAE